MAECSVCDGSGRFLLFPGEYETCPLCNGSGTEPDYLSPSQLLLIQEEIAFIESQRHFSLCEVDRWD